MTISNLSNTSFLHSNPAQAIERFISCIGQSVSIYVAYSGGMDSTVLLHLIHKQLSVSNQSHRLTVIHVNHGLQRQANAWEDYCQLYCQNLGVEFKALRIEIEDTRQKGIEAVARNKRYSAIIDFIQNTVEQNDAVLLTGHHQRDQAETVLLNMVRGAGVNGLAAMPSFKKMQSEAFNPCSDAFKMVSTNFTEIAHARPLLNVSYQSLKDYALEHSLEFVEDPSNRNSEFKRNWIRNELLPKISEQWPAVERQLTQTAQNMQDTLQVLDDSAKKMLEQTVFASDFVQINDGISALQKNLIRYWLKCFWSNITLSSVQMDWVLEALESYSSSQNQAYSYRLKNVELKVYKNRLYVLNAEPKPYQFRFESLNEVSLFIEQRLSYSAHNLKCCNLENFTFEINSLKSECQVGLMGFSQLPLDLKGPFKKQMKIFFQSKNIPVWQRDVWPVLFSEECGLLSVLGLDYGVIESCLLKIDSQHYQSVDKAKKVALMEISMSYEQMTSLWRKR